MKLTSLRIPHFSLLYLPTLSQVTTLMLLVSTISSISMSDRFSAIRKFSLSSYIPAALRAKNLFLLSIKYTLTQYYQNGLHRNSLSHPTLTSIYSFNLCVKQNKEHGSGGSYNYLNTLAFSWQCSWQCLIVPLWFPFQNKKTQKHLLGLDVFKFALLVQVLSKLKEFNIEFTPLPHYVAPAILAFLPECVYLKQPWHNALFWNAEAMEYLHKILLRVTDHP